MTYSLRSASTSNTWVSRSLLLRPLLTELDDQMTGYPRFRKLGTSFSINATDNSYARTIQWKRLKESTAPSFQIIGIVLDCPLFSHREAYLMSELRDSAIEHWKEVTIAGIRDQVYTFGLLTIHDRKVQFVHGSAHQFLWTAVMYGK